MPGAAWPASSEAIRNQPIYALRKEVVEAVIGKMREARRLRRFLLRSLENDDGDWQQITATHNLLKSYLYRRSQ